MSFLKEQRLRYGNTRDDNMGLLGQPRFMAIAQGDTKYLKFKDECQGQTGPGSFSLTLEVFFLYSEGHAGVVKLGRRRGLKILRALVHESSILSPGTHHATDVTPLWHFLWNPLILEIGR